MVMSKEFLGGDRATSSEEYLEALRLDSVDRAASSEEAEWAEKREEKWLARMREQEFKNLKYRGILRVDIKKDSKGEFTRVEVRDQDGKLLFFSTNREFEKEAEAGYGPN